jgi:O-antigen/teichoic acid export membrane protein
MATSVQNQDLYAQLVRHYKSAMASDFGRKVLETYLSRILVMGLTLVSTVVVSRLLGPEGRGYYAVAVATGTLGVQFATLGMNAGNGYFVAKQPELLPCLTGNTLVMSFGFGGLLAVLLGLVFSMRPDLLTIRGTILVLALLWIPLGSAFTLLQSLMLGLHDVRGYNLAEVGVRAISIVLLGILVVSHRVGIAALLATVLAATAICGGWVAARLRQRAPAKPRLSIEVFRKSIRYALKAYLATTFCFLVLRADLFMVQRMLGAQQAGYYSIASTMADYVSILAATVGAILFPKLSALTSLREKLNLTTKATIGISLALLPLLSVASLLARPVVRLLFGPEFLPASWSFVLLMPGMFFLGMHAVSVQFLNSIGYPKSVVIVWGLSSLFNIATNLWAIPHYGIAGASVVSSISYFFAFFFVVWIIFRTGYRHTELVS